MDKKHNFCIVNFNTQAFIDACIKSINKNVSDAIIYVFDNSDKEPFNNTFNNVIVFDNTKGNIIDFDKWLDKYPYAKKSFCYEQNKCGSAKHTYSIQKCIELIDDNFVLCDTDILIKGNIDDIFDDEYVCVADISQNRHSDGNIWNKKIMTNFCYLNVKKIKEQNSHFFNENKICGLTKDAKYDTGASFLEEIGEENVKKIKMSDYVEHFDGGSWKPNYQTSSKIWLNKYKYLYEYNNIVVSLTTHKPRFKYIHIVLQSLLNQTITPYKICLVLYEEDKQYITAELQSLIDDGKIEIITAYENIKAHTKYFYTMQKYKNCCIITVDDDIIYDNNIIEQLYNSYLNNKKCISARRVHLIKYDNNGIALKYKQWKHICKTITYPSFDLFFTGVGGVLYPPNCFNLSNDNLEDIKECINADDIYLNYLARKFGLKCIWVPNNRSMCNPIRDIEIQKSGLCHINTEGNIPLNDVYLKKFVFNKYDKLAFKNKNVIYTCITGNYDFLIEPKVITDNFDYVCFTDNTSLTSNTWEIRELPSDVLDLSQIKKQRCIKINPHKYLPEYDLSIWIDGSVSILSDLNSFVDENLIDNVSVYVPTHPYRSCIYKEGDAVIRMKKDNPAIVKSQLLQYKEEGFPSDYGLLQSNIMIRKHNSPDCIQLMECWWNEVKAKSHRDQLSFNYASWKNPTINIVYIDKNIYKSKWFIWNSKHKKNMPQKNKINNDNVLNSYLENNSNNDKIVKIKPKPRIIAKPLYVKQRTRIDKALKAFLK